MHMCLCNRYGERKQLSIIHELRLNEVKPNSILISTQMTLTNAFRLAMMIVQQISAESRENDTRTCDDRIALECSLLFPCTRRCVKQISSSVVGTFSALRHNELLRATRVQTVFLPSEQSYCALLDRPYSDQT